MTGSDKKEGERRVLEAARNVCCTFPAGEILLAEEPDLRINMGAEWLAVEVTELVRPSTENSFPPVQDEAFHRKVVRLAEEKYYQRPNAEPVCVCVCFLDEKRCERENREGWNRLVDKRTGRKLDKMADSLVEFVNRRPVHGVGSATFKKREMPGQTDSDTLPTGFEIIGISLAPGPWRSGESGTIPPLDRQELVVAIANKNALLPGYRANIPGTPIWLLIYSGAAVSHGVPVPKSIRDWEYDFDFERVFFFSCMDNRVFELRRSAANGGQN
jgi:hypothetical protein